MCMQFDWKAGRRFQMPESVRLLSDGTKSPAISLIHIGISTHVFYSLCHFHPVIQVYKHLLMYRIMQPGHVLFLCYMLLLLSARFRTSFKQSKIRIISIPFAIDFCTKYSTTSSAYGRYPKIFCPRNSICKFCILKSISELTKSLPWIFFQET